MYALLESLCYKWFVRLHRKRCLGFRIPCSNCHSMVEYNKRVNVQFALGAQHHSLTFCSHECAIEFLEKYWIKESYGEVGNKR